MDISPEYTPDSDMDSIEAALVLSVNETLVEIFGEEDAKEHLDIIYELEDADAVVNYAYGALLANGYRPEDLLIAMGVLESDDKTE